MLHHTNQQPSQGGGAIPDLVWIGSKYMLYHLQSPTLSISLQVI